ncbi:hypothetical protein [Methanobrevibacter gottschalkii]|nr:hypothetical protein [Methanobrevibacter gottschalkii]
MSGILKSTLFTVSSIQSLVSTADICGMAISSIIKNNANFTLIIITD